MQVPSLYFKIMFVAVFSDGSTKEVLHTSVCGTWETVYYLEKNFGVVLAKSTVYGCKSKIRPTKYPCGRDKSYYLGFLNWVLNFEKSSRAEFYDNELDKTKFTENNPVTDMYLILKK